MKAKKHLQIPALTIPLWWPNLPGNWCAWLPGRGNVLFTLLVVGGLLWASNAGALPLRAPALTGDSTTTITYQGRLADSSGNPVTSPGIGMQFCLYDTDVGGSPVDDWCENHTSVPVEDGLFHVLLGNIRPIPVSMLASHSSLWLGITVGSDSEMSPREFLTSVPYALYARSADVADGAITTSKLADQAVTTGKLADDAVTGPIIAADAVDPGKLPNRQRRISLPIWSLRGEAEITEEVAGMAFRIDHPSFGENGDFIVNTVLPLDFVGNNVTLQVTLKATAAGSFRGTSYVACQPADGTASPFWNVDAGTQFSFVDVPVENQIYSFTFTRTSSEFAPGCLLRLRLNFDDIPAGGPVYVYGIALLYEADS